MELAHYFRGGVGLLLESYGIAKDVLTRRLLSSPNNGKQTDTIHAEMFSYGFSSEKNKNNLSLKWAKQRSEVLANSECTLLRTRSV